MVYSTEVEHQCPLMKGCNHGPAPIPEEGKWVQAKQIKDISGYTHGVGWCAPQQGACKLSLNVKNGVIEEALVETIGCSGMTHSAAMASEILVGKTILEAFRYIRCYTFTAFRYIGYATLLLSGLSHFLCIDKNYNNYNVKNNSKQLHLCSPLSSVSSFSCDH